MSTPLVDAWDYPHGDPCIVLFTRALEQWKFDIPEGGRVLELGCCESQWAATLKRCRPDVHITGIDQRDGKDFYADRFVLGDASDIQWEGEPFDFVFAISSLEHFGLGWYGDPKGSLKDYEALVRAVDALKVGGHVYYDVPYTPSAMTQTEHYRVYDDAGLASRLMDDRLVLRAQGYAPNERESEFSPVRPLTPWSPFHFVARWLTKVA